MYITKKITERWSLWHTRHKISIVGITTNYNYLTLQMIHKRTILLPLYSDLRDAVSWQQEYIIFYQKTIQNWIYSHSILLISN